MPAIQFIIQHSSFIIPTSGPPGNRTPIAWVQAKRLPIGPAAHIIERSVPESNRIFLLTEEACCQNTYRPLSTTVIPDGLEPSSSWLSPRRLCRWTTESQVTEVGVEPTKSRGSRPRRFASLRTRSQVAGPGVAPGDPGL